MKPESTLYRTVQRTVLVSHSYLSQAFNISSTYLFNIYHQNVLEVSIFEPFDSRGTCFILSVLVYQITTQ